MGTITMGVRGWFQQPSSLVLGLLGVALFAVLEVVGCRIAGETFPDNPLKYRAVFGYLTVMNLLLVPLLAALVSTRWKTRLLVRLIHRSRVLRPSFGRGEI